MGRSAKVHKRVVSLMSTHAHPGAERLHPLAIAPQKRTTKPQSQPAPPPEPKSKTKSSGPTTTETVVQSAKKRADLRLKAKNKGKSATKGADGGHVLGGADYVTLMMGGRRKAAEEALKLPPKDS
ncbi:hypothetical protein EDD17DRAFT_1175153 [Pisolithus thermaeus]|nr:hypothetical protein EDD17DRAFT_1175153 [Pisolithus thermaeus]